MIVKLSTLLLTLVGCFLMSAALGADSLRVVSTKFCGNLNSTCSRKIDVIYLKKGHFLVSAMNSSGAIAKPEDDRENLDSLLGVAAKTQALAVFSVGFYRDPWITRQTGGFKTSNIVVSKEVDLPQSSFICFNSGSLTISRSSSAFSKSPNCIQVKPTIYESGRSSDDLRLEAGRGYFPPQYFKNSFGIFVASFKNGDAAVIVAHEHSYSEVQSFVKEFPLEGGEVSIVVGVSGGPFAGAIVRTPTTPIVIGEIRAGVPYTILVSSEQH